MTRQYALPLPHREATEADDFMIAASNREAAAWIDKWPDWPMHGLVIHGPPGAGKTHLAHVWRAKSGGLCAYDKLANAPPSVSSVAGSTASVLARKAATWQYPRNSPNNLLERRSRPE